MAHFKVFAGMVTVASLALSSAASAAVIFSGSGAGCADLACLVPTGNFNEATAEFTIADNTLTILLTNTSADPASGKAKPGDGLTGLSFTLSGAQLTPTSAVTQSGIFNPGACSSLTCSTVEGDDISLAVQDVDGEFAFSLSFPVAGSYGLSSAGYTGAFGAAFGSPNLDGAGAAVGGPQFSIISANWSASEMNVGFAASPHVIAAVLFTLTVSSGFFESAIADVRFWYGTAPDGSGNPGCAGADVGACAEIVVPEPNSMWLILIGLLGLGAFASRRKLSV